MDGSTLSSSSSTSSPSSTLRNDGLPPYTRSMAGFKLPSDDELRYEGVEKLIQRLRLCESEYKKSLLVERSRIMKDVNQQLQNHLVEMKGLKEINKKLVKENECLASEKEELGGMCCFLDDDREKAKKLAHEWQVFGRYAAAQMSKELSLCHDKIRELENKQKILSAENKSLKLKELRMAFDFERAGSRTSLDSQGSFHGAIPGLLDVAGTRDSGDGSSSGSTASNYSPDHKSFKSSAPPNKENLAESRENYIKYLENQLRQLEDAKGRAKKVSSTVPSTHGTFNMSPAKSDRRMLTQATRHSSNSSLSSSNSHTLTNEPYAVNGAMGNPLHVPSPRIPGGDNHMNVAPPPGPSSKQDTIAYAMKVLELQDQMDSSLPNSMYPGAPNDGNHLEEHHKEVIREMCNVVWRKLGDSRGNLRKPQPSRTLQHRTASVSNL